VPAEMLSEQASCDGRHAGRNDTRDARDADVGAAFGGGDYVGDDGLLEGDQSA